MYQCRDGRILWLLGFESERHFPGLARALGRPEWVEDPKYATATARAINARSLVAAIPASFLALDCVTEK